jgi:hypothetical protein
VPVNLEWAKETWRDLLNDRTHEDCRCPSCQYHLHRQKGGKFDKETFFLYWLELEVELSLIPQTDRLIFSTLSRPQDGGWRTSVTWRDFSRVRGTIQGLADYVAKYFPAIDAGASRIKLKLWRFKKSGVIKALDDEFIDRRVKALGPADKGGGTVQLAQRIADCVYSRPDRTASQRDLQRQLHEPADNLEDLRQWLLLNYGITCRRGKRKGQMIYQGTMQSSRGRILRVGIGPESHS